MAEKEGRWKILPKIIFKLSFSVGTAEGIHMVFLL